MIDGFVVNLGRRGPQGPKGDQGEKGDQGDQGEKGDTGPAGMPQWMNGGDSLPLRDIFVVDGLTLQAVDVGTAVYLALGGVIADRLTRLNALRLIEDQTSGNLYASDRTLQVNANMGDVTVQLPTVASAEGMDFFIHRIDLNPVVLYLSPDPSDTDARIYQLSGAPDPGQTVPLFGSDSAQRPLFRIYAARGDWYVVGV